MIYTWVQAPLTLLGANVFACMIIVAFIEFLWFFGIHGVLAVYPVLMLVFYQPMLDNLAAYSAGQPLPHLFTIGFILNNRGARSFAVALLAIFSCKSEQLKAVGENWVDSFYVWNLRPLANQIWDSAGDEHKDVDTTYGNTSCFCFISLFINDCWLYALS